MLNKWPRYNPSIPVYICLDLYPILFPLSSPLLSKSFRGNMSPPKVSFISGQDDNPHSKVQAPRKVKEKYTLNNETQSAKWGALNCSYIQGHPKDKGQAQGAEKTSSLGGSTFLHPTINGKARSTFPFNLGQEPESREARDLKNKNAKNLLRISKHEEVPVWDPDGEKTGKASWYQGGPRAAKWIPSSLSPPLIPNSMKLLSETSNF